MLTRYEILTELRRVGVEEPSLLKAYLRDFEDYIGIHYGLKIVKTKEKIERVGIGRGLLQIYAG